MTSYRLGERGGIDGKLVIIILLSLLFLGAGSLAIWLYVNYTDAKENVDSKVTAAAAEAKRTQADEDETKFSQREKEPMRQYVGPDDYGRLTFDYPKTWSAYQDSDVSGGNGATYAAYLNPIIVPPVAANALSDLVASKTETPSKNVVYKFALRIKIEQKSYEKSLVAYDPLLKTGQITSKAFTGADGVTGTRFDGRFNNDIRGSAVVIKMRDRTLTLRTDADVFKSDFDALIQTVKFNE